MMVAMEVTPTASYQRPSKQFFSHKTRDKITPLTTCTCSRSCPVRALSLLSLLHPPFARTRLSSSPTASQKPCPPPTLDKPSQAARYLGAISSRRVWRSFRRIPLDPAYVKPKFPQPSPKPRPNSRLITRPASHHRTKHETRDSLNANLTPS